MIETGIDVRVKIQDIVSAQLPDYVLNDSPLTDDFLKQFYISQEFQGGPMDFASNLDQYIDVTNLSNAVVVDNYNLTSPVGIDSTEVFVNTTKGFPNEWGLVKIDNEIITYTGVTTNSFTGVVRGFSGITSYREPVQPNNLVFEKSVADVHSTDAPVQNLSTLFLKEFFKKLKFTFSPGFENLEFNSEITPANWIQSCRAFYQSKGSEESIRILFKVLFGETPTVVDLEDFLIKASDAEFSRRDYSVVTPVSGNPIDLRGRTVYQSNDQSVFGAISEIEPFTRNNVLYYRIFFFVSTDEINDERKLFTIPGRTKCQRTFVSGIDTVITVDTTIGFRNNGEFIDSKGNKFYYKERTVNQFLGVTADAPGIVIGIGDEVIDDITVIGEDVNGNVITMRLTGTLTDISFPRGDLPFVSPGEKIRVDSLGENIVSDLGSRLDQKYYQIVANSFIYNTSVRFEVQSFSGSSFVVGTPYLDKAAIRPGDRVDILERGSQTIILGNRLVDNVEYSSSTIVISDSANIPVGKEVDVRRQQKYATSRVTPIDYGNDNILCNVLNLYDARDYDNNLYVATNSLPSYPIGVTVVGSLIPALTVESLEDFNSFQGTYSTIVFPTATKFITGDLVSYTVTGDAEPICPLGEYFVEVLDNPRKVKLYVSPSFIGSNNFVGLTLTEGNGSHILTLESQRNRQINTQRTYRRIPISGEFQNITNTRTPSEAESGTIAIMTNGVEIISYKSDDKVYLGGIIRVDAVSGGRGYSVTDPPTITIAEPQIQLTDPNIDPSAYKGRAEVSPVIKGKLETILIDPQEFDVDKVFSITVTGGNSRGATALPQIERRNRSIPFDTRVDELGGGINPNEETIQFLTPHNLAYGDAIVYNNRGQSSIGIGQYGGINNASELVLANGGIYYAEPVNNLTIRVYPTQGDLLSGINTVGFTSVGNGFGIQSFDTLTRNTLVGASIIEDGGDFWYRQLQASPENVVVPYDRIEYAKHGFKTGEIVEYVSTGTPIGGLSTTVSYYVTAVDDDSFQLSNAGVGGTSTFDFDRGEFAFLTSAGVGTHIFKYPDIEANVVVSFASTIRGEIVATPVIRGEINQVYVDKPGFYGSDIINFEKTPRVSITEGRGARVKPVIVDGQVISIQILNKGRQYPDNPDIRVIDSSESGDGALLRAVVVDGEIDEVIILSPGIGYNQNTTDIRIDDPGREAILNPRIRPLTVNLNERFGFEGIVNNDYSVVSYARTIRESVFFDDGNSHSPIIGWANDGNPIYGGFGLSDPEDFNSDFRAMKTSYDLNVSGVEGRPAISKYPPGFFIEDYSFTDSGDLDQYNGRYCRTPEFPNGVYAYFAGISTDVQSSERNPVFPYFIGPEYRDAPIRDSSEDVDQDFDLTDKPVYRNTFPYVVGDPTAGSEFLTQSYLFDTQDTIVQSVGVGQVNEIRVVGVGQSYRVGDLPVFDSSEDEVNSIVSAITGKEIEKISVDTLSYQKDSTKLIRLTKDKVRIYVEPNHNYNSGDTIVLSGLSTFTSVLAGPQIIRVDDKRMSLFSFVGPTAVGNVEDILVATVTDNVSVGSTLFLGEGPGRELVSVLNIFPDQKAIRIDRPDGFAGEHEVGDKIQVVPNFFDVEQPTDDFESEIDEVYYFNPKQTVGLGTPGDSGEDFETQFTVYTTTKNISVPVGAIYAPNHSFKNNEPVLFGKFNDGIIASLQVDDGAGFNNILPQGQDPFTLVYVVPLSKDFVGLRTDPSASNLFFVSNGTDDFRYYLKTQREAELVITDRIRASVETIEPHELENNDIVEVTVISKTTSGIGINSTVTVIYDDVSESLVIDPRKAQPSGINTDSNLIEVTDHDFILGDYVLYENYGTGIAGLETHRKYFVIPFDANRFELAETFEDIKPGDQLPIELQSVGVGTHTFSLVNPRINITNSNNVKFDIGDSSLLGRELNFYYDSALTEIFGSNGVDERFVVSGVGTIGFEGSQLRLQYSENNPSVIYYGITKGGYLSTADTLARENNTIQYIDSVYSRRVRVSKDTDTKFTYSLQDKPERSEYTQNDDISYVTSSINASGGIARVRLISSGKNFRSIPEFITVDSVFGGNATLRAESPDIGRLSSFRIQNPGWGYSADTTLRPKGKIQPTIEYDDSDFISSVDILYGGLGYQVPPDTVLVDSVTRETVISGSIELEVQSSTISEVKVDVAPSGLSKNAHELFTVNNSNGIPIILISGLQNVNNAGIATYSIQTPINNFAQRPFEVGDEVFVENVFGAKTEDVTALNSADYGYRFFPVIAVSPPDENPVKVTVQYPEGSAERIFDEDEVGIGVTFQGAFSSLINRKLYPVFNINQQTAIFVKGERLSLIIDVDKETGFDIVQETDLVVEETNTNFFKVRGNFDLVVGDRVKGSTSGVVVTISSIVSGECRFETSTISRVDNGWNNQVGVLNEEFQVTPDNNYYQNLSYSIKSTIDFETLIGPVNRLVHPAGLKNFADVKIESSAGIGLTAESGESITLDFIGLTDRVNTPLRVDRINVFDLGYDDNLRGNKTNAIRFNSKTPNKRLTDYIEVRTNRVLLCDDISGDFIDSDNIREQLPYTDFPVINSVWTRGLLLSRNPFTDQFDFQEIIVLAYDNNAYTMQKTLTADNEEGYGTFEGISLRSSEYSMRYVPYDTETFDLDHKLFVNKLVFGNKGDINIGYTELSGVNRLVSPLSTIEIYRAETSNVRSVVLHVILEREGGRPYYYEVYAAKLGNDTHVAVYGFGATESNDVNPDFIGSFEAGIAPGNRLRVQYNNGINEEVRVATKTIEFRPVESNRSIDNPYRFKRASLKPGQERTLILESTSNVGSATTTDTIEYYRLNADLFQTVRSIVYVSTSDMVTFQQVMSTNDFSGFTHAAEYPFLREGSGIPGPGIGTFGTRIGISTLGERQMIMEFYPDEALTGTNIEIIAFHEAFYRDIDTKNYRNEPLRYGQMEENYYIDRYIAPQGQRTDNKRFELTYENFPIFEKQFNPGDVLTNTGVGNFNIFNIEEHFLSTGEEVYYIPDTTAAGGDIVAPIEIDPITIGSTTYTTMPERVFVIKRDLNRFSLAATFDDAITLNPISITGVGLGNGHRIGMVKKLQKSAITIDGVLQSPLASAEIIFPLAQSSAFDDEYMVLTGIGTIRVGDIMQAEEEFVIIENIGFAESPTGPITNTGPFPLIQVERGTVGTAATDHASGIDLALYRGSYNIVESDIVFTEAPNGRGQLNLNESNIVVTNSSFQGRVFLQREYDQIAVYDDISDQFDGQTPFFDVTSRGANVGTGTVGEIENGSGLLLINDIYQTPTTDNNQGNNYVYGYNAITGVNTVTFTGVTSTNGQRVESLFDVNQNQIPRGGLIVSLGSTPGLGYAPLYGASLQPDVQNGVIVGVITTNQIGVTTAVRYAEYDNETGDLVVTAYNEPQTPQLAVTDADYFESSGILLVDIGQPLANFGIEPGDVVVLDGLTMECLSTGSPNTLVYPDKDSAFIVENLVTDSKFAVVAGVSTIAHTYVSGGTVQKMAPFIFGREGQDPDFVHLDGLRFECPEKPYQATINITNAPYDNVSGVVTITTSVPHGVLPGNEVTVAGLAYTCSSNVYGATDAVYTPETGITTITLNTFHSYEIGDTVTLAGFGFTCDPNEYSGGIAINSGEYDETTGIATLTADAPLGIQSGDRVFIDNMTWQCDSGSGLQDGLFPSGVNGKIFEATLIAPNKFEVNVGVSTIAHTYQTGGVVRPGITTNIYPTGNNGFDFTITDIPSATTLVVNVGDAISNILLPIPHTYSGGGTVAGKTSNIFPLADNEDTFNVVSVISPTTFTLNVGPVPGIPHTYISGGTANVGVTTDFFPDQDEYLPFVFRDDAAHFRVLAGVSSFPHIYDGGGVIGQYTKNNPGSGYNHEVVITVEEEGHTGAAATIIGIPGPGGELSFNIVNGGSGYTDPYIWAPDPVYFNLPVTGVFRRKTGFGTDVGKNLFVTCEIGAAKTTAIGRSEFFEVSNFEISNQGYSFEEGDIIEVVGLVTDKRLSAPIEPFQLSIEDIFTDNFSAWNFGELDYIDSIANLQDGIRTRFPLIYKGEQFSFEQNLADEDSAAIDMDSILLIFVNTVLQVPKLNYNFDGGTAFEFTRAPFPEDDIDIYFYRGKRNLDSRVVTEVDESIRPGDELQLKKNDYINITQPSNPKTKTQEIRTVTEIASSDTVRTNIYFGAGDLETVRPRQVAWDKQKRDIFIYGEAAPKTRDSLEPIIQPTASIIRDLGRTDTVIRLSSPNLFDYEENLTSPPTVLTNIEARMYQGLRDDFVPAEIEITVSSDGRCISANVINQGANYTSRPQITIPAPYGGQDGIDNRATLGFTFTSGRVTGANIIEQGSGYNPSKPPIPLISEPEFVYEDIDLIPNVQGFAGILTGLVSSQQGPNKRIRFEYEVDPRVETPGSLVPGDSIVIFNTFVGNGVETIDNLGRTVGLGTQFIDAVYEVESTFVLGKRAAATCRVDFNTDITGITTTGDNLGYLSWGRMSQVQRNVDVSVAFNDVDGTTFQADMDNYPRIVRTTEGLRNEGGLTKAV